MIVIVIVILVLGDEDLLRLGETLGRRLPSLNGAMRHCRCVSVEQREREREEEVECEAKRLARARREILGCVNP